MVRLFKATGRDGDEFCESCSRVGDSACRASSLLESARGKVLAHGGRLV
jgi:hypothetical protein